MGKFEEIPNKKIGSEETDFWEEISGSFLLNRFYRQFDGAEGWLGNGYFIMWSRKELKDFRASNLEIYSEKYHFFGSNGGGTQFGFIIIDEEAQFLSAPDIGSEEDIRVLGNWQDFISSIKYDDYI